ncbi:MAG TPA: chorismate-binding protein, partial [Candidatus Brocadiia bacterium]|nr:chorismate-binding protein [Candidatus Brocadiia bacterium]
PGGSITGAPKVRAMEIIDELEPTRRSVYTGAIGWLGFEGGMALNVAIRTFLTRGQDAFFQVGGGIVADSDEAAEYEETLHKAHGLMDSLGRAADDGERRPRMIADDGERRRTEMAMVSGGRAEGDPDNHGRFVDQRRVRG